jgi:hypothetical protein
MKRIRQLFGYVDLATLMASDDLDKRSRSPELRIPSTQMEDVQHFKGSGKGSLRDAIPLPQPLHDRTGSLGAAEHTQTGVTAAEPAAAAYPSNPIVRSKEDFQHFKGSGRGSLGDAIPLPQPLDDRTGSQGAAEHTQTGVTAAEPAAAVHLSNLIVRSRAGKKMSPQEIGAWVRDNYKEIANAWQGNVTELCLGMNCLWKGIKKGKSGGESTQYEYFNGIFRGWAEDEFVIVS